MRQVKFKKWIPAVFPDGANSVNCNTTHKPISGTNCWESDFVNTGLFHGWGVSYEEFENGAGNYTVALIENPDGIIEEVLPKNIKFYN